MNNATLTLLVTAVLAAPPALALESPPTPPVPGDAAYWRSWAQDLTHELKHDMGAMFAPRMGPGKLVKGAPYSAEVVTESSQTLADGNVISRRKTGAVYRDGEGRTRQETGAEGKERTVFINDPVANTHFVLTPGSKRATAAAPRAMSFRYDKNVTVTRIDSGDGSQREEVRVQVIRPGEGGMHIAPGTPIPPVPPVPPAAPLPPPALPGITTMRFESTARLGKGVTTSLGMKDFDGVKAEGKAITWTIPAGEIGNRNAITVSSESWYSPDLQVTVYSRHGDPRTGESIYRLASIRRGEPAADLFKVPDDYKMRSRAPKG